MLISKVYIFTYKTTRIKAAVTTKLGITTFKKRDKNSSILLNFCKTSLRVSERELNSWWSSCETCIGYDCFFWSHGLLWKLKWPTMDIENLNIFVGHASGINETSPSYKLCWRLVTHRNVASLSASMFNVWVLRKPALKHFLLLRSYVIQMAVFHIFDCISSLINKTEQQPRQILSSISLYIVLWIPHNAKTQLNFRTLTIYQWF